MKIMSLFIALATPSAVNAEDWWLVVQDKDAVQFIDRSTIKKDGEVLQFWSRTYSRTNYKLNGVQYTTVKYRHDCRQELYSLNYILAQLKTGKSQYEGPFQDDWQPAPPGTIAQTRMNFVCKAYTLGHFNVKTLDMVDRMGQDFVTGKVEKFVRQ